MRVFGLVWVKRILKINQLTLKIKINFKELKNLPKVKLFL